MEVSKKNKVYGLLGRDIGYSFSRGYFTEKFEKLGIEDSEYVNFDIPSIEDFSALIKKQQFQLHGMNVTIPYKQEVIPFLDKLDNTAKKIGAVNTIKFTKKGLLKGYNTDVVGFENSLTPFLKKHHKRALILGTGGASKAIAFSLKRLGIQYRFVSRSPLKKKEISYESITQKVMERYTILINSSPVGTFPNVHLMPQIPYIWITKQHLLFDLIYNPSETSFLKEGKMKGASIKNGLQMLELQAEESWRIWNQ
ncbi:shikimate dehydrogenase [Polaribacter sp. HL-MS24]|uniref:shikimate dehydrogenase family protein n=1 Tax=Polaribacter sp. HL-MS24 TaxID=3077735 RepID=UPI002934349F|nr:shikimate dehydrogenase [Polaribacter sp. HL-MS24]WOC39704.1 shikimate dehydrogenase [Polaribacter sp. HL-MS24]